jgi:putative transposase
MPFGYISDSTLVIAGVPAQRSAGPFLEDLLAERGIKVSYEAILLWCTKFGSRYLRKLRSNHQGVGDTFQFVRIGGKQHYLCRAVDQDGEVVDVLL